MILYTDKQYEVAKDLLELTIKLGKRGIFAVFNYSTKPTSSFFIYNESLEEQFFRFFHTKADWSKEYEQLSEDIKPIIDKLEEK
jgi:hypothetical protein